MACIGVVNWLSLETLSILVLENLNLIPILIYQLGFALIFNLAVFLF